MLTAGDVRGTLEILNVDDMLIDTIVAMLNDSSDDLDGRKNEGGVAAAAFGGAPTGLDLGANAAIAHQHVKDAILEMVAGLQGYAKNVETFRREVHASDEAAESGFMTLAEAESCVTAPTFHANASCAAPTEQQGEG